MDLCLNYINYTNMDPIMTSLDGDSLCIIVYQMLLVFIHSNRTSLVGLWLSDWLQR